MAIDKQTKDKLIAIIGALMPHAKIYLYGSHARGTARLGSDIDLALDTGNKIPIRDLGEITNVIEGLSIPYKIDVVDMYSISPEMRHEIERDKILWKA